MGSVNAYLISDRDGFTLVDCGWGGQAAGAVLEEHLNALGATIGDIGRVIATHAHVDHYGFAAELHQRTGAEIAIHEDDIQLATRWFAGTTVYAEALAGWFIRNGAPTADAMAAGADLIAVAEHIALAKTHRALRGGDRISTGAGSFEVIHTPGHTEGHIALFQREMALLITGDHVLPQVTPNVSCFAHTAPDPLGRHLRSLTELRALPVRRVLPGHGLPFDGLGERVDKLIASHQAHAEAVARGLGIEPLSAFEISTRVRWGRGIAWGDLGVRRRRLALLATLARLAYLEAGGRARAVERGGTIKYIAQ